MAGVVDETRLIVCGSGVIWFGGGGDENCDREGRVMSDYELG